MARWSVKQPNSPHLSVASGPPHHGPSPSSPLLWSNSPQQQQQRSKLSMERVELMSNDRAEQVPPTAPTPQFHRNPLLYLQHLLQQHPT